MNCNEYRFVGSESMILNSGLHCSWIIFFAAAAALLIFLILLDFDSVVEVLNYQWVFSL